jgi:hypothetical protein
VGNALDIGSASVSETTISFGSGVAFLELQLAKKRRHKKMRAAFFMK